MERLPLRLLALALLALAGGAGCGSGGDSTATKQEEENFRNPSQTPPPEAGNIGGPGARGMGAPPQAKGGP